EAERAKALALDGAAPFDPMGDGRRSDKVMLPEGFMRKPAELRRWVTKAFDAAALLPPKQATAKKKAKPSVGTRSASKGAAAGRAAPAKRTASGARKKSPR